MEILAIVEKFGLPLAMLAFMTWLYLRSETFHRLDKDRYEKVIEDVHRHCDENFQKTRDLHINERAEWFGKLERVTEDNTKAIRELSLAIRDHDFITPAKPKGIGEHAKL